jgi:hypothetical protein
VTVHTIRMSLFSFFLATTLMGIFFISITPVLENFDEMGHYSAITQTFYSKNIPPRNEMLIDKKIIFYQGPRSYSNGTGPFDNGLTYNKFFKDSKKVEKYLNNRKSQAEEERFIASDKINGEFQQHPPAYYVLMAPVYFLVKNNSLIFQFFFLRLSSFFLALVGLWLSVKAIFDSGMKIQEKLYGIIFYPLLFPMFFGEFSRIGNDSLCLLLSGALVLTYTRWYKSHYDFVLSILIGIIIGIGLITKGFFIIIYIAVVTYTLFNFIAKNEKYTKRKIKGLLTIIFIPITLGGWWYCNNYLSIGTISGTAISVEINKQGNFLSNVINNFDLFKFIRGIITIPVTYIWGGSQSLVHPNYLLYIPLLVLAAFIYSKSFIDAFRSKDYPLERLSIWVITIFILGLAWYCISCFAVGWSNNTPGWYLHILIPFTAPLVGIGITRIIDEIKSKIFLFLSLNYLMLFFFYIIWSQITLFSGYSTKNYDKHYSYECEYLCLHEIKNIYRNIDIIGYGNIAFLALTISAIIYIFLYKNTLEKLIARKH